MSKIEQDSFSSVLSVNPYKKSYYSGVASFVSESTSPSFSKEQFAISYLNTNGFITSLIAISKNIPDEDLFDAINSKVYDDLGLDQAVEYSLQYVESFNNLDEDNRYFHVFIVDPLSLTQVFENTIENIKYLDVIIPAPLLIKSLYTKDLISYTGTHCFIYFQENDAFVTIYGDGEFIYTKSIKYSFIDMHDRFCELYGERIDYDKFLNFFTTHNLKDTQSDYKIFFIKLYKELFANVNDILTYAKRAFDIEKFDQIYIGSQVDTKTKLYEMLEVELNIKTVEFEFDYGFEGTGEFVDQLHSLMHLYTTLPSDEKYIANFSPYHRPPKFTQRESGKLILVMAASFILAFAYPVTYWGLTYAQDLQKELLQKNYKDLHIQRTTREATIKNRQADKTKSIKLLAREKEEYINKKNTLIKIHDVKVNYPMKAKLLAMFTKDFNTYGVHLQSATYSQDSISKQLHFSLIATKDKKITKLLEHLTKIYDGKFKFSLELISYDYEEKRYLSELKVVIL